MSDGSEIETGTTGRIVYARVRPNEDLVHGIEKICLREGIGRCFIRGSLGSLNLLGPRLLPLLMRGGPSIRPRAAAWRK